MFGILDQSTSTKDQSWTDLFTSSELLYKFYVTLYIVSICCAILCNIKDVYIGMKWDFCIQTKMQSKWADKLILYLYKFKKLTESLDICILNIGPFNWIVLSNWKFSNDQRQIVVSWLEETRTSLALLTWSAVTGPLWCLILTTWKKNK